MSVETLRKILSIGRDNLLAEGRRSLDEPQQARQDREDWQAELTARQKELDRNQLILSDYVAAQRYLSPLEVTYSKEAAAQIRKLETECAVNYTAANFADIADLIECASRVPRLLGRVITRLVTDLMPRAAVEVARCQWQVKEALTQIALYEAAHVAGEFISYAEPMAAAMGASAIEPPPKLSLFEERAAKAAQEEQRAHQEFIQQNSKLEELARATVRAMI